MAASPYGFWPSTITSDLVVADSIRLEQVALDGDAIYWTETQPQKQGRTFLYRVGADGEPERLTPDYANAFSVRARAHEYGGGAFAVSEGVIYFSNNIDQRLYRQDAGRPPSPITPAPAGAAADAFRYADGVIDRRRGRMVCVREDHTGAGEAITTLVAVDLSGATATQVLVSGNDFYSTPRLSPDGNRMSWLTWRHPDMPWVATEGWVGDILLDGTIGNRRRVAGGPDELVFQPEWSPHGDLYFVSDRASGWWNLYREHDGAIEPMAEMDAEFGRPQWQFGMSTYAFESADRLISCFVRDGVWTLAGIDTRSKRFDFIPTDFTDIAQLRAAPGRVVFTGGSSSEAPCARRPRPEQRNSPRLASLVRPSRGGPSLRFGPPANRFPDGQRGDGPFVLLSALFARVRRASGREGAGAREESRRADGVHLEYPLAFDAILDEPRDWGARRELSRQHRLWPPLSAAARKTVGPRRRRGLRRRRALVGREPECRPRAAHDQRRQRRWLHDALRAHA